MYILWKTTFDTFLSSKGFGGAEMVSQCYLWLMCECDLKHGFYVENLHFLSSLVPDLREEL